MVSSRAAAVSTVGSCCYVIITTNNSPGSHAGMQQSALNYNLNGIWIKLNESGIYSVLYCLLDVRLRCLWSLCEYASSLSAGSEVNLIV